MDAWYSHPPRQTNQRGWAWQVGKGVGLGGAVRGFSLPTHMTLPKAPRPMALMTLYFLLMVNSCPDTTTVWEAMVNQVREVKGGRGWEGAL